MIKILYIVSTLRCCGPTLQLFNLIKYLDRKCFIPQILTLSPEPKSSSKDNFLRLSVPVNSLGMGQLSSFCLARNRICDFIADHKPDIVHSCGFRADLLTIWAGCGLHTAATIRGSFLENYTYGFGLMGRYLMAPIHIRMLQRIERRVIVSDILRRRFIKDYGIVCDFIPNGVDQEIFHPVTSEQKRLIRKELGLPVEGVLFAVTGYLSKLKDPLCAAEGFLKSAIPNAAMIFIGDGDLKGKLKILGKSGKIILSGTVNNVQAYLQASDFLVSCSRTEGMPNAVLEAMACGLPCILSDIEPHREIIDYQPQAGTLFSAGNPEKLKEAICLTMNQPYEIKQQAALWIINNHLNAKKTSKLYQSLYEDILRVQLVK